jgi:hypothetical protein
VYNFYHSGSRITILPKFKSKVIEIPFITIIKIDFLRFRRLAIKAKYPKGYISFGVFVTNSFKVLAQGF